MKRFVGCVVLSFGISLSALAANPGTTVNWSLFGTYALQLSNVHQRSWGQDFPCTYIDQNNVTHTITVHAGGSLTFTTIDMGFVNFFGDGTFHALFREDNQFDQAASDATVSVQFDANCNTTNVDGGHAVLLANPQMSVDGTYTITNGGTGVIFPATGKGSLLFVVGGGAVSTCMKGGVITAYPATVLMHGVPDVEAPVGTAVFHGITVPCQ